MMSMWMSFSTTTLRSLYLRVWGGMRGGCTGQHMVVCHVSCINAGCAIRKPMKACIICLCVLLWVLSTGASQA